ncbi:hypothetical protein ACEQ8H_008566 [Pleosporales sp. CAS-2024a]
MAPPRPRWETASKKQAPAKSQKPLKARVQHEVVPLAEPSIPLDLQQVLLNIFKNAFAQRFEADIKPLLQQVKGHLYNRDFATAFGKNEYLEAYAARWSPSRALGYAHLFMDLRAQLWPEVAGAKETKRRRVVCLGGGAGAELVALAAVQKMLWRESQDQAPAKMDIKNVDIADWTAVVHLLAKHVTILPPLSKYASAAVQAANAALVDPGSFDVSFSKLDVLHVEHGILSETLNSAHLVTLMFTLNELYSTSLPLTQKFLLNLTSALASGALLLVVDSPGSYSTITLNGADKKYPMQWLLDHTLLQTGEKDKNKELAKWEKIHEDESRWFRLAHTLQYPIDLENMRMQLHLVVGAKTGDMNAVKLRSTGWAANALPVYCYRSEQRVSQVLINLLLRLIRSEFLRSVRDAEPCPLWDDAYNGATRFTDS